LAWFVIDAVGVMDATAFYPAYREDGHASRGLRAVDDGRLGVALLIARRALFEGDRQSV
jgi:hypothetical protein